MAGLKTVRKNDFAEVTFPYYRYVSLENPDARDLF